MARGGKRAGAGRKPGKVSKAKRDIAEMAKEHGEAALAVLFDIAKNGEAEASRVSAANALLDRGYGRPSQAIDHSSTDGTMSPSPTIDPEKLSDEAKLELLNAATDEG